MIPTFLRRPAAVGALGIASLVSLATTASGAPSVAREWSEQTLAAIRIDRPRPPVHARNLYHISVAMWDAWAAYDPYADQVLHHERATAPDIEAARREAISFAAYRTIRYRYSQAFSVGYVATQAALDAKMAALGYDINNASVVGNTPAALGNRIFLTIKGAGLSDGANETGNFAANNFYFPVNAPLILAFPGATMNDANRWQPLAFSYFVNQNGIPEGALTQTFVCPHWSSVTPFSIKRSDPAQPYMDPGPPPLLGTATDAEFKSDFVAAIRYSSELDPNDGTMLNISPGVHHNNPLGTNDGAGYPVNPVTGLPYAPNVVRRGDYARVLAEFWADGPQSETPPGHWNVLANKVSDDALTVKRIGGVGPILSDLEWDVKIYLAVNGAEHDAAIACWGNKGKYDSSRPISVIRYLGGLGQSSDSNLPSYHPNGLPLTPGLVELITTETGAPGGTHAHLTGPGHDQNIGKVAIYAWRGQPTDPFTQIGGVGWILPANWWPYQKTTFVTPPFAGFYSGHSTYSRSGAEVMSAFTGSTYFPGGLGTYTFPMNAFLTFELGPSQAVQLQWATYYDAADEAGISRIWGGIHTPSDDFKGRLMGSRVGKTAFAKARKYFQGRISCPGDFNGTHQVTVQDMFDFLRAWFVQSGTVGDGLAADMNEDATINIMDVYAFLDGWFQPCPLGSPPPPLPVLPSGLLEAIPVKGKGKVGRQT